MKNPFELERKIFSAWMKRFQIPVGTAYEITARKSLRVKGKKVSQTMIQTLLTKSDVVVVGDHRLVSSDQGQMISLGAQFQKAKKNIVCLTDRLLKKHQIYLNQFQQGQCSLPSLLKKIHLECQESGYPDSGIQDILCWAKTSRIPLMACGIQSNWNDLHSMDQHLVDVLTRTIKNQKQNHVMVWTGAIRLAPCMLPRQLIQQKISALCLVFDSPDTRFVNQQDQEWISIGDHIFVFVERSPLLSLETHRAWNLHKGPLILVQDIEQMFEVSLRRIANRTYDEVPKLPKLLLHPFNLKAFQYFSTHSLNCRKVKFLWTRLKRGESAVLLQDRIVLLSSLEKSHIAEEAAHYLRLKYVNRQSFGPMTIVLEEALAYLASTWFDVNREEVFLKQPMNGKDEWQALHQLGYTLGKKLVKLWNTSKKSQRWIVDIWKTAPCDHQEMLFMLHKIWNS